MNFHRYTIAPVGLELNCFRGLKMYAKLCGFDPNEL